MGYDPNGTVNWWKVGAIALVAVAVIGGTILTVATFGAGSVAGTIAISSVITLAAKATEVASLQIKKSVSEGDTSGEIFSDTVDAIFGNGLKIIGLTPLTKTAGFASGIYSQSNIFIQTWNLMKVDGFNGKNFVGGSLYSLGERFRNMPTSKSGYLIAYGFAAWEVGNTIYSIFDNDPIARAKQRGYNLY